ncbi:MAG: CDP-archaeol synthase [Pseudomonadota bacterium]
MAELWLVWYLQVPVVIGGVLHMVAVSRNWCPRLVRPVHRGLFGANKTWRGFVLVPLFTAGGALLLAPVELLLGERAPVGAAAWGVAGFLAGLGYMLGELPNSFFKRRLGIAPGATPERGRQFFVLLDQLDSGIGVALAYALFPGLSLSAFLLFILTFPLTALGTKRLLFLARLKSSPA